MKTITHKLGLLSLLACCGLCYQLYKKDSQVSFYTKEHAKTYQQSPTSEQVSVHKQKRSNTTKIDTQNTQKSISMQKTTASQTIYIQLLGAIQKPGVYALKQPSELFKVIQEAGGPLKQAHLDTLDLTKTLTKSQKISIPFKTQAKNIDLQNPGPFKKRMNINQASLKELVQLPGIGPKTAKDIIAYRKRIGRLYKLESLKKISGIGPKKIEKLRDLVSF